MTALISTTPCRGPSVFLPLLPFIFATVLSLLSNTMAIQPSAVLHPAEYGSTYTLPRRSTSLSTTRAGAGSNCSAMPGGWEVDYGGLMTVVQQVDDVLCTLLAVRIGGPNSSNAAHGSLDVLGINSVTGAVSWTIDDIPGADELFGDQGDFQQVWLDGVNQRLYVSGWNATAKQRCSWVRAYQYQGNAPVTEAWQGQHCVATTSLTVNFRSTLLVWPWADSGAGGAPLGLVDGGSIGDDYYGNSRYANATLTLFDGATGRLLHESDAPTSKPVTVAACGDYSQPHSNVQRLSWFHDYYWSWQGIAAVFEVYRNGSVQQLGQTLQWAEKTLPAWRLLGTEASCLLIRQDAQPGNYSVWDIPSGELLWTNSTGSIALVTHPLNTSLIVLASVTLALRLWTFTYLDTHTGSLVAQSPTVVFGDAKQTGGSANYPQYQFDVPGVIYTELYLHVENRPVNHTWLAFDVNTLELINSGPTALDVSEIRFRPLSVDSNSATALWQSNQTEQSTYTAGKLNTTAAVDQSSSSHHEGDITHSAVVQMTEAVE